MERETACRRKKEAAEQFDLGGRISNIQEYGNGHINDTFLLCIEEADKTEKKAILQRMNHEVFQQPVQVMENILQVTSYLKKKITETGGDPERETLNVYPARDGKPYYRDEDGNYWRAYAFIDHAVSYDAVERPEIFYESARAFGRFQRMLAQFPSDTLHETIVGFHDTKARFARFEQVVSEDKCGRAAEVRAEIDFVLARKETAEVLGRMQQEGQLPLRVTHNDTKLNNILMDEATGKAACIIDLDTVMPGLSVHDFGDAIRFGANTGAEDETDLSKVSCDLSLFALYTKGFLEGCDGSLTQEEIRALPIGARAMTLECGMRFLTDYLEGDVYYKIHRPKHNLDRCRSQFKLLADMEEKQSEMERIVAGAFGTVE